MSKKLKYIFLCLCGIVAIKSQAQEISSVLKNGQWLKIGIEKNGAYKLDYNTLKSAGLPVDNISPKTFQLYGNGGGMLPQKNAESRPNDLIENNIYVTGEADGAFNPSDYIIFYAQGPDSYFYSNDSLSYINNIYSDKNYYYLTFGQKEGARVGQEINVSGSYPVIDQFDDFIYYEDEKFNVLNSGREWYSSLFNSTNNKDQRFSFSAPGLLTGSSVIMSSAVMAQSFATSNFNINVNGAKIGSQTLLSIPNYITPSQNNPNRYSIKGQEDLQRFAFTINDIQEGNINIDYSFSINTSGLCDGYLNYFLIEFQRALNLYETQTIFRSIKSKTNTVTTFKVGNGNSNTKIWNITDPLKVNSQSFSISGNTLQFSTPTDFLKEFIAFDESKIDIPTDINAINNQNLHAAVNTELIIITHNSLINEAKELSNYHNSTSTTSAVYTVSQIYNEYSSGKQDITAIRDFIKQQYDKSSTLKYVLLFGKGSYDYKNVLDIDVQNLVPIYESNNSLHPLYSFPSDDYYGFMEDEEGEWLEENGGNHTLELGIGRLPVTTPEEAKIVVDKIINYNTDRASLGNWRKEIVFVADDGDNNTHADQADQLATYIDTTFVAFNYKKLFLDYYKQTSNGAQTRSEAMEKVLIDQIDKGALVVNYTGHGGRAIWMQESVLTESVINQLENYNKLPLFVTATCNFGVHDDPANESGGELLLKSENKGAIGLITTCRAVYSASNFELNKAFYNEIFKQIDNNYPTLGDVIRQTKNNSINNAIDPAKVGNRNFSLLGDPAMKLAYPQQAITIQSINNIPTDTLKALGLITIAGKVNNETYNGVLDVEIFDKETPMLTKGDESTPYQFLARENTIYRGKASVKNGSFTFDFIVPKNISYTLGEGKISLYASSSNSLQDAASGYNKIIVGGSSANPDNDTTGPDINIYFGDSTYRSGTPVSSNTLLVLKLEDEHGINISKYGVDNNITANIDNEDVIILNDHYTATIDNYKKGWVLFPLENLKPGLHNLKVSAWDTYNNNSTKTISFTVSDEGSFKILNLENSPNPFYYETSISFDHNRAGEDLEAELNVINNQGQVISNLTFAIDNSSSHVTLYTWSPRDANNKNLIPGIYYIRLFVRSLKDGASNTAYQKLILVN